MSRSQRDTYSTDTNSIDSFEDSLIEDSSYAMALENAGPLHSVECSDSGAFINTIRAVLDRLPGDMASYLTTEITSLFDSWFEGLALLDPQDGTSVHDLNEV